MKRSTWIGKALVFSASLLPAPKATGGVFTDEAGRRGDRPVAMPVIIPVRFRLK